MSKIVIDLDEKQTSAARAAAPEFGDYQEPRERSFFFKVLKVFAIVAGFAILVSAITGLFYWRHLKTTPKYSLALLVEAARREDQKLIDELIDTDAVVDDFVPQIIDKAVELYGRGVAPTIVKRASRIAAPFIPMVKKRARAELPNLLRAKTEAFEKIPFWAMVLGADRYLEFEYEGEQVRVTSKIEDRPLDLTMKRNGDKWQIVRFSDEKLARQIAGKIGQEVIALTKQRSKTSIDNIGRQIGIPNLGDIVDKAEDIWR